MTEPVSDVLQTTLEVVVNGTTYVFAIPGYTDEIKLGIEERNIRRELDPESGGSPEGLDADTMFIVRTAAVFKVLLRQCSDQWPYVKDEATQLPVVNFKKWPPEKVGEALTASMQFNQALARFRGQGTPDKKPPGTEALAGGADTKPVAV